MDAFEVAIYRTDACAALSIYMVMLVFGAIVLVHWAGAKSVIAGTLWLA